MDHRRPAAQSPMTPPQRVAEANHGNQIGGGSLTCFARASVARLQQSTPTNVAERTLGISGTRVGKFPTSAPSAATPAIKSTEGPEIFTSSRRNGSSFKTLSVFLFARLSSDGSQLGQVECKVGPASWRVPQLGQFEYAILGTTTRLLSFVLLGRLTRTFPKSEI